MANYCKQISWIILLDTNLSTSQNANCQIDSDSNIVLNINMHIYILQHILASLIVTQTDTVCTSLCPGDRTKVNLAAVSATTIYKLAH